MSEPARDPDSLIGERIFGGYVVTRRIGQGGIGAVYAAENPELRTQLAVKVLLPERSSNSTIARRFMAEARAASAINHRNIIQVIDAGQLDSGLYYIVMEYLEGETLARWGRRKARVDIGDALNILVQICSGLEYAHLRGIIHRDLKPANLFIAPQPENPLFAKILDFGIAKLNDESLSDGFETRTEASAGTPNYMSPEQARALRDVDQRTDIYALGVIAYELLTKQLPYKAHSIGELAYQHSSSMPAAPRQLRSDIPPGWNELIGAALSVDTKDRPRSCRELAERMIEATPGGEAIARSAAPLLFQPPPDDPTKPLRIPPPPEVQVSVTESIGDDDDPMVIGTAPTEAATPTPAPTPAEPTAPPSVQAGRRSRSWLWLAAVAAVAGAIAVYVATRGDDATPRPEPTAAEPAAEPAEPTQPIVVQPMAAKSELTVTSEPAGATVYVDGLAADGTTPLTVTVEQGAAARIKVAKEGFEPVVETVTPMGDSAELAVELAAAERPKPRKPKRRKPPDKPKQSGDTETDPGELFDTRK